MKIDSTRSATRDNVLTVDRGLQVLRAFRSESGSRTNAELVQLTGLSKATISRLTSTLLELGYIRRVSGGRQFELSTGVLGIGHAFIATNPIQARAYPFMQELADRLNVSVALATGNGPDMLYVVYRVSRRISTLRMGIGSMLPMATSMVGRAYLWGLPARQRQIQIAQLRSMLSAQGVTREDLEKWEKELQIAFTNLETRGVCYSQGGPGYQRSTFGVALPVRVGKQRIHMALSCGSVELPSRIEVMRSRVEPALLEARPEFERLLADIDLDE